MKNKFIVIEGIDGTGKSSVSKLLSEKLNEIGEKTIFIKSPLGEFTKCSNYVNNNCNTLSHYLFYLSGVVHTSEMIRELLLNSNVVCDRYIYSTQAYHIGQNVQPVIDASSLSLLVPDFSFYLYVTDESVRRDRINSRVTIEKGDEEIFVKDGLLDKIDSQFKKFNLIEIDNTYSTIQDTVLTILNRIND